MATFSKAAFDTAKYAAARPTYPRQLFDFVFRFHEHGSTNTGPGAIPSPTDGGNTGALRTRERVRWDTALDLGCGTGQATPELHPFRRVIGVDPSAKMLVGARQHLADVLGSSHSESPSPNPSQSQSQGQYEFVQSPAERLSFLEDGSVDLVVSAQAAHWFDWTALWPELARVLRTNGTVAFWGYSEMRLSRYPTLTPLIHAYSRGTDPKDSIGPYWEQPGRSIVDNHLQDVPAAENVVPGAFRAEERVYFTGSHYPTLPSPRPVILRKKTTWGGFEAYLHSFSALHTFRAQNPADAARPEGDVAARFVKQLKEGVRGVGAENGVEDGDEVEVEWPLALVLVKRV
ncbi:hypothetical protein M0805_001219 [Coniferiporia weirii]|nr:hypothetical protein M0805_001219 [Coniferiporia weirii]